MKAPVEPSINAVNVQLTWRAHQTLVGDDAVTRGLAKLPPDLAEAYRAVGSFGWVPVKLIDSVTYAVAGAAGWPAERLSRESARIGVETLLKGLWRVMLRFTSDEALIARTPLLYSKTYNIGRLESVFPRPGVAEVTHSGWVGITDLQLVGLSAGIETVLRCADRGSPRVTFARTPTGASFTATWTR